MREFLFSILILLNVIGFSQSNRYSREDSIKGGVTHEREWWNVLHYKLNVTFSVSDSSINGVNEISYKVLAPYQIMQVDLMEPMQIDSVKQKNEKIICKHKDQTYYINLLANQIVDSINTIDIYFHGKPKAAKLPPWDGGIVWQKDKNKNPWVSIACQGLAGSVWFPCKDHMYDEPDSVSFYVTAPNSLVAVSNGRLRSVRENPNNTKTYNWAVVNPINNYNIIPYIGKYVNFTDTFMGEGGKLDLSYWVLDYNLEKAKAQFAQVKTMLRCFEMWFGKYPFYEDGYKLVESPYLGMEHQSAVAYGNNYINGYNGRDLSSTGWGLKWDFIIVHESGHEWFGNNISARDVADNWVHEGFTAYSENLYTEYLFGKDAGAEYVIGTRQSVENDKPVIGDYEVNNEGSGDMYYKASNMLHTIRQIVNNDSLWRECLRSLNRTFRHQTVTTKQVEEYMIRFLKIDLQKIFDQYLRTAKIPQFEYLWEGNSLSMRWTNCVNGFNMPVRVNVGNNSLLFRPTENWNTIGLPSKLDLSVNRNYYVNTREVKKK